MAFDLKRVLKVMLFAANSPLSVKDIQTAIGRFHEQAEGLQLTDEAPAAEAAVASDAASPAAENPAEPQPAADSVESIPPPVEDDEMYQDVPTLITTAQIREAMESIGQELVAAASDVLLVEGHSGWRMVTHPRFARWVRLLRNEPPPVRLSPSALETLAVVAYRQPVTRADIEQIRGVSAEAGLSKLLERDLVYVVGRADLPGRPIQYGTTDAFLEFVGIKSLDELPASDVLSPRQIDAWLQTSNQPRAAGDSDMGLDETEETQLSLESAAAKAETPPATE
jgi:segregation and condensation protein B